MFSPYTVPLIHRRRLGLVTSLAGILGFLNVMTLQADSWPESGKSVELDYATLTAAEVDSGEATLEFKSIPAEKSFSIPAPGEAQITSVHWRQPASGQNQPSWKLSADSRSLNIHLPAEYSPVERFVVVESTDQSRQFIGGRITLLRDTAKKSSSGSDFVWSYKPTRWGRYDVELTYSATRDSNPLQVDLKEESWNILAPSTGGLETKHNLAIGRIYLADENAFDLKVTLDSELCSDRFQIHAITLRPAPEGDPIVQDPESGDLELHSRQAITRSVLMRYEPKDIKNCLGYWANPADWAEWRFEVTEPGTFYLDVYQGCGKGHGGSEVAVEVAGQRYTFEVLDTGHFQNFVQRRLGKIFLPQAGSYTLKVNPIMKAGGAVMDIRTIQLKPVKDATSSAVLMKTVQEAQRILILGDSITYGGGYVVDLETALRQAFPQSSFEIINIGLPSETVSGLSEPGHAGGNFPRPALGERLDRAFEKVQPDLVFACYGMNDGIYYPFSTERFEAFQDGIYALRDRAAQDNVPVIHLTPPVFDPHPIRNRTLPAGLDHYKQPYKGYDDVLFLYGEWLLAQQVEGWLVIDIHGPMKRVLNRSRETNPDFILAGDGVHANAQGHWIMAREVLKALEVSIPGLQNDTPDEWVGSDPALARIRQLVARKQSILKDAWLNHVGHLRPGMRAGVSIYEAAEQARELDVEIFQTLNPTWPGKRTTWHGFDTVHLDIQGFDTTIVLPRKPATGAPWVWHGEFFGHKPAPDIALLERGFHAVYMRIPDRLGSPEAVARWSDLYEELTQVYGLSTKPALVGLSRGGLYCYNWASRNPEKVSCIYGDAPVCDFKSWPGGFGKGKGSARDWDLVLKQYGFECDAEAKAYTGNPVDSLKPLAAAGVPLLHVFGDADEVVPWDENTGVIAERYEAFGGNIRLIRKPGVGHHPHGLEDSTPIVEFILEANGM